MFAVKRPDLITHKVRAEYLSVTVVERGTLESAENKDVICRVKAGSKGTYASTIRWVIDDGTIVNKGQLLMELDDSALQDQFRTQSIAVEKAKAEWVKADEEFAIQVKQNDSDVATAIAALKVADLDLDKFLGVRVDSTLAPTGAVVGAYGTLIERGEYRQKLDDVSGRLKLAESDLEAYRDRSAWADRQVRLKNLTPSQAKVERSKLDAALDNVEKLTKEKYVLETFLRQRDLTDFVSKAEVARLGLDRVNRQASSKLTQAESTRRTAYSVYQQELDKLREIEEQIRECKVYSPHDGMVVYYKDTGSRWGSSNEGMIQQGAQVKEGQKMLRIPDLKKMQVNTKIHEALIARIRGDDRQSTGFLEAVRVGLTASPEPLTRLMSLSETETGMIRERYRDKEYYLASQGQKAKIRVDAHSDRLYEGHVRTVAAVASQQDWMASDVKVYQTLVTIDEVVEGLRPDMSAEVTIQIDPPKEPVLCVPIQAVVGGAEIGPKRKLYVMTPNGPQEKEVTLGLFNDKMVEVRDGLKEGDDVILNPKVLLGNSVKTREEAAPAQAGPRGPGGGKGEGKKGMGGKGGAGGMKGAGGAPKGQGQMPQG